MTKNSDWVQDDFEKETESKSTSENEEKIFEELKEEAAKKEKKSRSGKGFKWKWLILIALIILITQGLYIVPEGNVAYITQFGKIVGTQENAGLHLRLPFIQQANILTNKIMLYDVSPSEVLTGDKKAMVVDSYALWRISDVTKYVRTVGNIPETQKRIDAAVYSTIKNIMGRRQQSEIISDEESSRATLNQEVTEVVNEAMTGYGIEMLRVEIRKYDLPTDNLAAVYNRMISERQQMATSYKADGEYQAAKIKNDTDKEYGIIVGEAEAKVQQIYGEAEKEYMSILQELYGEKEKAEFYSFMLELDALKNSIRGEKTVVLGPDSPIAKILGAGE